MYVKLLKHAFFNVCLSCKHHRKMIIYIRGVSSVDSEVFYFHMCAWSFTLFNDLTIQCPWIQNMASWTSRCIIWHSNNPDVTSASHSLSQKLRDSSRTEDNYANCCWQMSNVSVKVNYSFNWKSNNRQKGQEKQENSDISSTENPGKIVDWQQIAPMMSFLAQLHLPDCHYPFCSALSTPFQMGAIAYSAVTQSIPVIAKSAQIIAGKK